MQKLTLIKFLTGYIPQGFAFVLSIYASCKVKIDKHNYIISSLLMVVIIWLIRSLPIQMGVNTLFNMLALIAICYCINKLPLNRTVLSCVSVTVFMLIIELVCVFLTSIVLHVDLFDMQDNETFKTYIAIPTSFVFLGFMLLFYKIRTRNLDKGN